MMIPNIVMKFNNFDIFFSTFVNFFDLSSALACRVVSVKMAVLGFRVSKYILNVHWVMGRNRLNVLFWKFAVSLFSPIGQAGQSSTKLVENTGILCIRLLLLTIKDNKIHIFARQLSIVLSL